MKKLISMHFIGILALAILCSGTQGRRIHERKAMDT